MGTLHEETDVLQFRDPQQPNLHLVYYTRAPLPDKANPNLLFWNHGIGEHTGRYKKFAKRVLSTCTSLDAMIMYDMRCHGQSDGARGSIKHAKDLVDDVYEHVLPRMALRYGSGARVVLGGHSLGGMVIAGVGARRDCLKMEDCGQVIGVILSAPAIDVAVTGAVNKLLVPVAGALARIPGTRGITKSNGIDVKALSHDEDVLEAYMKDDMVHDQVSVGLGADMFSFGKIVFAAIEEDEECMLNSVKSLVLHGGSDTVVRMEGSKNLTEAINKKGKSVSKFVEVEQAFHEMHNEQPEMGSDKFFQEVCQFLSDLFANAPVAAPEQ